jgi:hypothetical protein
VPAGGHHAMPMLALSMGMLSASIGLPQDASLPASTAPKTERAVTAFMSKVDAPGVFVGVSRGTTVRWANDHGLADIEQFVPAKALGCDESRQGRK